MELAADSHPYPARDDRISRFGKVARPKNKAQAVFLRQFLLFLRKLITEAHPQKNGSTINNGKWTICSPRFYWH